MITNSERTKILEMIEDGTITAEEGLTLLNALGESSTPNIDIYDDESEPTPLPESVDDQLESIKLSKIQEVTHGEQIKPVSAVHADEPINKDFFTDTTKDPFKDSQTVKGEVEVIKSDSQPPTPEEIDRWKRWWMIPLWIGAGITVTGGLLMYWAYSTKGYGFWFACSWFPFLLGVALLALAWNSRIAPWLHVRITQAPGERPQKIAFSFPIPIRLTVWGLRTFGRHIPHMQDTNLDEVILAMKDISKDGTPFFVDVDDGEDGERVQVFIG